MTGSLFFPDEPGVRYAPRSNEEREDLNARVRASVKFIAQREAKAEGVSLAWFTEMALERLATETFDAREKGLVRLPMGFDVEKLELLEGAARRAGRPLATWLDHGLQHLATANGPAVENTEEAAA